MLAFNTFNRSHQLRPGIALLATKMVLHNRASFEAQSVSVEVGRKGGKLAPAGEGLGADKESASTATTTPWATWRRERTCACVRAAT